MGSIYQPEAWLTYVLHLDAASIIRQCSGPKRRLAAEDELGRSRTGQLCLLLIQIAAEYFSVACD